ncbi:MAG TPA: hypothetical protein VL197_14090 [Nitrospirota bacterium]|nr:hypothetical protein [Nitrospirota bacterium]
MKPVDILEWTMGWAWPIMTGIAVLMALSVARIMSWDEQDLSQEKSSGPIPGKNCVCQCG